MSKIPQGYVLQKGFYQPDTTIDLVLYVETFDRDEGFEIIATKQILDLTGKDAHHKLMKFVRDNIKDNRWYMDNDVYQMLYGGHNRR